TFHDAPYRGWLYVALVVGCAGTAVALFRGNDPGGWLAAALLPLGAVVAFVLSPPRRPPGGAGHLGDSTQSLARASPAVAGGPGGPDAPRARGRRPRRAGGRLPPARTGRLTRRRRSERLPSAKSLWALGFTGTRHFWGRFSRGSEHELRERLDGLGLRRADD